MKRKRNNPPFADPLIDEIRAIRKELSDRFGDDWQGYCDYLRRVGEEYRARTGRFRDLKRRRKSG